MGKVENHCFRIFICNVMINCIQKQYPFRSGGIFKSIPIHTKKKSMLLCNGEFSLEAVVKKVVQ